MDPLKKMAALEPAKRAVSLLDEFKQFAFKGNVIDLAVGVIIGAAFGKIVASLVEHIIMPLVNVVIPGEQSYKGWTFTINNKAIPFGLFLGKVVNFLIVAVVLFFFIVKFVGRLTHLRREEAAAPAPLTKEEELLTEIRDLLKKSETRPPETAG